MKIGRCVAAIAIVSTLSGVAAAGYRYPGFQVGHAGNSVDAWSFGTLATVRAAPDSLQYIGCRISGRPTGGATPLVTCTARDANNVTKTCTTLNPSTPLLVAAANVGRDSYVQFNYDAAGNCTGIHVDNYSSNPVTAP